MDANCGEVYSEAPAKLNTTLDSLDELRNIGVARIETGVGVDDAYDRPRQGVFTVAERFDEDLA